MSTPEYLMDELRRFIAQGGEPIELAVRLGYRSPSTVVRWVRQNDIPRWKRRDVSKVIAILTKEIKR